MQETFLNDLTEGELLALPWLFEFWAMEHQLPPEGDWRSWVILGGRGAGKTRAGAEWVRSMVEGARPLDPGISKRMALVGETLDQVREVMIFGESGILACTPPDRKPVWESTRKRLVWPNGAVAQAFSAHDPESLRGPQFDAAWVDELAKWRRGEEAWDMLQFCLRLGERPRQCVTTTPRNVPVLKRLLKAESTVQTHAATQVNKANLAASFLEEVERRYGGSRLGLQELDGRLLEDVEGALWTSSQLSGCRSGADEPARIVVAVDPPVTGGAKADTCGIVVAGVTADGERAVVLEDASVKGSPLEWAQAAIAAYHRHGADRVVAEVNQGGELIEAILRQVDRTVSYRGVYASRGKVCRAEPVAALYEQGRVAHRGQMDELEAQMVQMAVGGFRGAGSPDRVDALVWALTELMLGRSSRPGVRRL
ncbi:DNA-packaging protein [Palleronia sp.]|uniref:DNA-packaging protein n=1 Tax=Palleronia sp. TaxID=1940284 RepID=UPI0035C7B135